MKSFTAVLFTGILILCFACKTPKQRQLSKDELKVELRKAIDEFNQAFAEADTAKLKMMLTEDYQHSNSYYEAIGKDSWLGYVGQRKADLDSGEMELLNYALDQERIQVIGNTGILSGRIKVNSRFGADTSTSAYRITNVWIRDDSIWKRAAFHDGKIN